MVGKFEVKNELLDSLPNGRRGVPVHFFRNLAETINLDQIIENVITQLPSLEGAEFCRIKALLFKNLEDQCRQIKTEPLVKAHRQLELFDAFPDQVSQQGQKTIDIGICRARAFLQSPSISRILWFI